MIERYCRPHMRQLWSTKKKYDVWLKIELGVCEALVRHGEMPKEAWTTLKSKAKVNQKRIGQLETTVKHDVIAFLSSITERVGPAGRYLHWGMTSSDLTDTALALLMRQATDILLEDLLAFMEVLKQLAHTHKETLMMGRSHGMHAEPITFGLKMLLGYEEMRRHKERLQRAKEEISVGKISGSMGTYAHLSPLVEAEVLKKLGLKPEPIANQIVQRDRHAHYLHVLALIATSLERMAIEIRHLQRTEIMEVEEPFTEGQKGSSSMPHKKNPIGCENICGLARVIRSYATAAMENVPLWHERDISHSSVERIILPDATTLLDFMLNRFTQIMTRLQIYPDRMIQNMEKSSGIVYSQKMLLALIQKGMKREAAYQIIQKIALSVLEEGGTFEQKALSHPGLQSQLRPDEIRGCFDPKRYLQQIDTIYKRVLP